MAGVALAVGVGAIVAGGAIAGSVAAKSAANSAAKAQRAGYDAVQTVNIDELNNKALSADSKRFENQFKLQEQFDPTVANLRKTGASKLLDGLNDNPDANNLLHQLTQEGATDSPKRAALIDQLFNSAQDELNAGATLPPAFQQELVRAGLEKTGAAGTTGSGAAGVEARTLLGSAGMALQTQRRSNAEQLLSTADALKQNRASILANTLGAAENTLSQRAGRAANAYSIGAAGVPQAGLTGGDVTNLSVANTNLQNQVALGRAGVNANLALAKGAANQQLIGGLTSAATGVIGGVGGGGGGAGSLLSGLGGMGGGAGAGNGFSTPQYNTYAQQPNAYGYSTFNRGQYLV